MVSSDNEEETESKEEEEKEIIEQIQDRKTRKRRSTGGKAPRETKKNRKAESHSEEEEEEEVEEILEKKTRQRSSTGGGKHQRGSNQALADNSETGDSHSDIGSTGGMRPTRKSWRPRGSSDADTDNWVDPARPTKGPVLDVFANAKEWAENFKRLDEFREIIRGPVAPVTLPPPAPVVLPPPGTPGLDFAGMIGLFKSMAEVMVTAVRVVQPQALPASAAPVQVVTPADPLTLETFERLLAALGDKSKADK